MTNSPVSKKEELRIVFEGFARKVIDRLREATGGRGFELVHRTRTVFSNNGTTDEEFTRPSTRAFSISKDTWYANPDIVDIAMTFVEAGVLEVPQFFDSEGKPVVNPSREVMAGPIVVELVGPILNAIESTVNGVLTDQELRQCFDDAWDFWHRTESTHRVIVPIMGLRDPLPTIPLIDGLSISPISAEDKSFLTDQIYFDPMHPIDLMRCHAQITGILKVPRNQQLEWAPLERVVRNAVTAFRLIRDGHIGAPRMTWKCTDRLWVSPYHSHNLDYLTIPYGPYYEFGSGDVNDFQSTFKTLCAVDSSSAFEKGIRLSLRRFNIAYSRDFQEDRLIDLSIAIEALLHHGKDRGNNLQAASFRAATLLRKRQSPKLTRQIMRAFADTRNALVHTGETFNTIEMPKSVRDLTPAVSHTFDVVARAQGLARLILQEYLEHIKTGSDVGRVNSELDADVYHAIQALP